MQLAQCKNCHQDFVYDDMKHAYTYGKGNLIFCSIMCVTEFMAKHNIQGNYFAKQKGAERMATPARVVILTVDELDRRMEQAAYKAVAKFVKDQEEQSKDDALLTTTELVKLGKYGKSRETIKKFREQIIAENPNQKIAIKHGRNWSYKLKAFDEWFVNHNEAHKEALKTDPRLRR